MPRISLGVWKDMLSIICHSLPPLKLSAAPAGRSLTVTRLCHLKCFCQLKRLCQLKCVRHTAWGHVPEVGSFHTRSSSRRNLPGHWQHHPFEAALGQCNTSFIDIDKGQVPQVGSFQAQNSSGQNLPRQVHSFEAAVQCNNSNTFMVDRIEGPSITGAGSLFRYLFLWDTDKQRYIYLH